MILEYSYSVINSTLQVQVQFVLVVLIYELHLAKVVGDGHPIIKQHYEETGFEVVKLQNQIFLTVDQYAQALVDISAYDFVSWGGGHRESLLLVTSRARAGADAPRSRTVMINDVTNRIMEPGCNMHRLTKLLAMVYLKTIAIHYQDEV